MEASSTKLSQAEIRQAQHTEEVSSNGACTALTTSMLVPVLRLSTNHMFCLACSAGFKSIAHVFMLVLRKTGHLLQCSEFNSPVLNLACQVTIVATVAEPCSAT